MRSLAMFRYPRAIDSILSLSRGVILDMARANGDRNSLLFDQRVPRFKNVVVRDVRDRDGGQLGRIIQSHNGTESGVITAAQDATDRMYAEFSAASNIQSRICATDSNGSPGQVISSTFFPWGASVRCKLARVWTGALGPAKS